MNGYVVQAGAKNSISFLFNKNVYSLVFLRRNAFIITDNELKLMAVAAIIGDNSLPRSVLLQGA